MKSELKTRCEFALRGMTSPIKNEELKDAINYITSAVGSEEKADNIIKEMFKYCEDGYEVKHFVCNTLEGMALLTITIKAKKDKTYNVLDEYGVFCSVYNFDCPYCSELGYSYFQNDKNGILRRIG